MNILILCIRKIMHLYKLHVREAYTHNQGDFKDEQIIDWMVFFMMMILDKHLRFTTQMVIQ